MLKNFVSTISKLRFPVHQYQKQNQQQPANCLLQQFALFNNSNQQQSANCLLQQFALFNNSLPLQQFRQAAISRPASSFSEIDKAAIYRSLPFAARLSSIPASLAIISTFQFCVWFWRAPSDCDLHRNSLLPEIHVCLTITLFLASAVADCPLPGLRSLYLCFSFVAILFSNCSTSACFSGFASCF